MMMDVSSSVVCEMVRCKPEQWQSATSRPSAPVKSGVNQLQPLSIDPQMPQKQVSRLKSLQALRAKRLS